jgi:tetratricopeptide (TPR) repeat protein
MENNIRYDQVVVVSARDDHVKRDRISLKDFRPRSIMAFTSGAEALEMLDEEDVDLVICDTELSDMHGCKFLRILRQKPNHRDTPVVMVTIEAKKNAVLDAIAAGCTGYIIRPYSQETFKRHLVLAKQVERFSEIELEQLKEARDMVNQGSFDEAIEEFEEILSLEDEAQKYYDMGCDYLLEEKYGKAIISFNKAIKINNLFAEAYKGLADAYKGKGDEAAYKANLQRASEVYAQLDRLDEAKNLFIEILKIDTDAPNPYNTLGVKLRRKGDYPAAIHNYLRAIQLSPEDENILFNLSKAYYFMDEKDKAKKALVRALSINDDFPEAVQFYKKLFNKDWTKTEKAKARSDIASGKSKALMDI